MLVLHNQIMEIIKLHAYIYVITLKTSSTERNTVELLLAISSSREAAPRPRPRAPAEAADGSRGGSDGSDGFLWMPSDVIGSAAIQAMSLPVLRMGPFLLFAPGRPLMHPLLIPCMGCGTCMEHGSAQTRCIIRSERLGVLYSNCNYFSQIRPIVCRRRAHRPDNIER